MLIINKAVCSEVNNAELAEIGLLNRRSGSLESQLLSNPFARGLKT